jgi:hypothetical protein
MPSKIKRKIANAKVLVLGSLSTTVLEYTVTRINESEHAPEALITLMPKK